MKLGIVLPQGLTGEYAGWAPADAWARTLAVARQADELGFESVWVYDHLGTFGTIRDEPFFEAFAVLASLATATRRVRFGPLVARAHLRNPALLAKHASSIDVISGGRFELGLGAGSSRREAAAFGFDFLPIRERMVHLAETLEIVRTLFREGRATFQGEHVRVADGIDNPRGLQEPRIPITVGGNGHTTWRIAAQYADELNLDGPSPAAVAEMLPLIRSICADVGRDPETLKVSIHVLPEDIGNAGPNRVRLLEGYRDAGMSRVIALIPDAVTRDDALEHLAADARTAGVELDGA